MTRFHLECFHIHSPRGCLHPTFNAFLSISLARRCQPGPDARRELITSWSSRKDNIFLGLASFGRPRLRLTGAEASLILGDERSGTSSPICDRALRAFRQRRRPPVRSNRHRAQAHRQGSQCFAPALLFFGMTVPHRDYSPTRGDWRPDQNDDTAPEPTSAHKPTLRICKPLGRLSQQPGEASGTLWQEYSLLAPNNTPRD